MNIIQPTEATNISGQQTIVGSTAEGHVINDGTNNRIVIGYQKDGFGTGSDYGIKVSKSGNNVLTAGNANLIMSSAFNLFKIVATGTTTVTVANPPVAGTLYTSAVTHNLGIQPAVLAYITNGPGSTQGTPIPFHSYSLSGAAFDILFYARVYMDTTTATFELSNANGSNFYSGVYTIRYYLLQETAN